jgi:glycosyltransferase involved in cell wall biosynthesis
MRRVVLVINGTDFGGTESALFQTACRLRSRGHDVHVLSIKTIGRIGKRLEREGVPVTSLEMPESVGFATLMSGCWKMARWLRARRVDVVHSFLPRANVMSRVAVRLARMRVPHISSERSTDLKRRHAVALLNRYTVRWTDRVLAVSATVRQVLIERERIPAAKIRVLENGIDLHAIDATPRVDLRSLIGLGPDVALLCSAGRLVADKGHIYLLRAIGAMQERGRVHLAIVGEGPEESALRSEAAAAGIGDRVHFMGYRDDLIGILKSTDVFVLPSLEEGIPVVVLEAMACSVPVVATDVGGVAALVESRRTGLIVPPAERWSDEARSRQQGAPVAAARGVEELASAIDRLVSDRAAAREMGRAGRERVEAQFAIDRIVCRLEQEYAEAVADPAYA